MAFILFMIGFAMVPVLILWVVFRLQKSQPTKKIVRQKNTLKSKNTGHSEEPGKYRTEVSSDEFMKVIATEIVNPFGPSLPQHGL